MYKFGIFSRVYKICIPGLVFARVCNCFIKGQSVFVVNKFIHTVKDVGVVYLVRGTSFGGHSVDSRAVVKLVLVAGGKI